MPTIDLVVESTTSQSVRARQVSAMFDVPPEEKCRLTWQCDLPIEGDDWRVGLIVGPNSTATFQAVKDDVSRAPVPNCVTAVADESIGGAPFSFRTGVSDLGHGLFRFVPAREVVDRNFLDALLRQLHGDRPANSAGAASDQCGVERDLHHHGLDPCNRRRGESHGPPEARLT